MTVALISLHVEESPAAFPLASAVLKAAIEADSRLSGCRVDIHEFTLPAGAPDIAATLIKSGYDAFGFSVYTWNADEVIETARLLKAELSDALIFAGGPQVTAIPAEFEKTGLFTFIITGEGEGVLPDMLLNPDKPKAGASSEFDFSSSPSPYPSVLKKGRQHSGLLWEVSRGCPFRCAFCYEARGSKTIRTISSERLIAELKLFNKKKIEKIWVLDPTFNHSQTHAVEVLEAIHTHHPDAHYTFEIRAELMNEELCGLLSELDASLQIGLQSTDAEVLSSANRNLDARKFQQKCRMMSSWGLTYGIDLIYGMPFDNLEKFRKSLDFAVDAGPNNIDIFPLAVLPGTELSDNAEKFELNNTGFPEYLVTGNSSFPAADLKKAAAITSACDKLYNKEQSFPWFRTVVTALKTTSSALFERWAQSGTGEADVIDFLSREFTKADSRSFFPIIESFILWSRTAEAAFSNPGTPFLVELCRKPEQLDELAGISPEAFLKRYPKPKVRKYQVLFDGQELFIN